MMRYFLAVLLVLLVAVPAEAIDFDSSGHSEVNGPCFGEAGRSIMNTGWDNCVQTIKCERWTFNPKDNSYNCERGFIEPAPRPEFELPNLSKTCNDIIGPFNSDTIRLIISEECNIRRENQKAIADELRYLRKEVEAMKK